MFYLGQNRGIPNRLMASNNQVAPVPQLVVLDPDEAVQQFESGGGNLTIFSIFGEDPLADFPDLVSEREGFCSNILIMDHFSIQ